MSTLADKMPPLAIPKKDLEIWGQLWLGDNNPETGKSKEPYFLIGSKALILPHLLTWRLV